MKLNRYIVLTLIVAVVPATAFAGELTPGESYLAPGRSPEFTTYTLDGGGRTQSALVRSALLLTRLTRSRLTILLTF